MLSALSTTTRTRLLASIVQQFTARVNQLLDYADQHPDASLTELETLSHQLSAACWAPVLEAALEHGRPRSDPPASPPCPTCQQPLHYKGTLPRTLLTRVGPITLRRGYYYCTGCHQGTYLRDQALGLGRGQFSEGVQQAVCQLAADLPFERAAATWTSLCGLPISASEVGRLAETRGQQLEAQLRAQQAQLQQGQAVAADPQPPRQLRPHGPGIWAVALDAARIHFRDDWHEVKAGVVFWARPKASTAPDVAQEWDGATTSAQSYVAVAGSMEEAGERLALEAARRGVPDDAPVVCLGDGAPSIWVQFAAQFPRRVEVLDWYHAVQHLWAAGKGVYAEDWAAAAWVRARKQELWDGQVEEVLAALHVAAASEATGAAAEAEIHYFETNAARMRYPQYRAAGYPIGSGTVESACKRVVGARAKGAGMRWSKEGVQAVLSLRAELLSARWEQSWPLTRPLANAA